MIATDYHDTFNTCAPEEGAAVSDRRNDNDGRRSETAATAKVRFPFAVAWTIAEELRETLAPASERIVIAGSLRRRKPDVGDIELLYIPRVVPLRDPDDMFADRTANLADLVIRYLESVGALERRKNVNGSEMFGPKNKLMRHVRSGINVDLFAATPENWFNYLVCRTGPAESNMRIATAAQARGWKWNPYGAGFSVAAVSDRRDADDGRRSETAATVLAVHSERAVFEFAGLEYREPWERR